MKRARTITSFYQIQSSEELNEINQEDGIGTCLNEANVVLDPNDIVGDPGLRKPIENFDMNIRDVARREYLLLGPCQPKGYQFPKKKMGNRNRSFQESWFQKHEWLEYSVAKDAAFCFYCFLFKQPRRKNFGVESFTGDIGFTNWKHATNAFDVHVGNVNSAHNKSRNCYENFRNQMQNMSNAISTSCCEDLGHFTIVLDVVRFLLLQNLSFHGHDKSTSSNNKGNFLEMVEWIKRKDTSAKQLLDSASGIPEIRKQCCEACVEETKNAILAEIGDKNFAIIVDETRDAIIKKQMIIILRFVNEEGYVIERFLGFQHVIDITSASLKGTLDDMLSKHNLSIKKVRGQGYDGASNMREEFHGLQKLVLDENPYAFYVHCFAHPLQLVVVSIAKCCYSIMDFFNYINLIVNTVNTSCKRHDQLVQHQHEILVQRLENGDIFRGRGENQETNIAKPEYTRWGSHHKTLCHLQLMWNVVLEVLENVCDDATNQEQRTIAAGLLEKMENFEFVFIMHLMIKVLGKTNDLSQYLQRKDPNIVRIIGLVEATIKLMNDVRHNGWDALFEEAKNFCLKQNIIVPDMSTKRPKRGRSRCHGGQLVTYYEHFHDEIFNVVLDQILVEFNNRFAESSTQLLRYVACLDPRNYFSSFDQDKLVELAKIYADDFSEYDCIMLRDQLDAFIIEARANSSFISCCDLSNLAIKMVQTDMHTTFPLVYRLVELVLILPVATATVERAFSTTEIIKTELENKMSDEWMDHYIICYIEREIFASIEDCKIIEQAMRTQRKQIPHVNASGSGIDESGRIN